MRRSAWAPVGVKASLKERIASQIEELIESSRLRTDDQLPPERELASLLNVSRPSLREALKVLEGRGRLLVRHGRGVFVRKPSASLDASPSVNGVDLHELFAMREVLEGPAAAWAAKSATARDLVDLRAILRRLEAAADSPDPDFERLRQLDASFHLRIASMARNRFLGKTTEVLHEMIASGMQTTLTIPGRLKRSQRDHRRIVLAIAAGDSTAARQAMLSHIHGAREAALGRLASLGSRTTSQRGARTRGRD